MDKQDFWTLVMLFILICLVIAFVVHSWILQQKLFYKYNEVTETLCNEYNYSFHDAQFSFFDSSYCYEINRGVMTVYILNKNCIKANFELNKDQCYLKQSEGEK